MEKKIYVANWKMNLSFNQAVTFCTNNSQALEQLSSNAEIIICPSFDDLAPTSNLLKNKNIMIGAQNCSEYTKGAYTGEVSSVSLAEMGVNYCIVGHSERRMYYHETTESIIKKIYLLYATNITPIICIGETHTEFLDNTTYNVLTEQLHPIIKSIHQQKEKHKKVIVAYEPIWAIGTGLIPEQEQLNAVFAWLSEFTQTQLPDYDIQLLYGGSVDQNNIAILKKTPLINGFLIGGASTNFDQFKTIITI